MVSYAGSNLALLRGLAAASRAPSSSLSSTWRRRVDCRQISQVAKSNAKPLFLVRRLEEQGLPSKQAEAITASITEVLNDTIETFTHSFVSKPEMQKIELIQDSSLSKFKSEVQNSQIDLIVKVDSFNLSFGITGNSPGHHFSLLQHETEKLKGDIEKMRSELRYEVDKVAAGQRLDMNLERGRIRDELASQNQETCSLTNKLDREVHSLRAQVEAAKYDVIKYCIGTLVSISAVSLAMIRTLM
ncbi:hypothetical protein LguiB_033062 [Lonicera macranthoides]